MTGWLKLETVLRSISSLHAWVPMRSSLLVFEAILDKTLRVRDTSGSSHGSLPVPKSRTSSILVSRPHPRRHEQVDNDQCKCILNNLSDHDGLLDSHHPSHSDAPLEILRLLPFAILLAFSQ